MPRPPRLEFPHAFYHVFSRGNRRAPIFHSPDDYAFFEKNLLDFADLCAVRLYAWCLMPNHFHLLVETPNANISLFMRRLLTRIAKRFNAKYRLVGHVFQGRYKAVVCQDDVYFQTLLRYIHSNPIRRKRGKALVSKLSDWPWSSHRFYMGDAPPAGAASAISDGMGRFGKGPVEMSKCYEEFMTGTIGAGRRTTFEMPLGARFLGNDAFIESIKKKTAEPTRIVPRALSRFTRAADFVSKAAMISGISVDELRAGDRKMFLTRWRQAIIYVGRTYLRMPSSDLGRELGRDGTAVSQVMRRKGRELAGENETKRLLEGISAGS